MGKKLTVETTYRPLKGLKKLPGNPRKISPEQFRKLVQSIKDNPDYFEARPLLLSDRTGEMIIIAGNQRYDAAKEVGLKEVPTVLLSGLTEAREREIIIRDNVASGEFDFSLLTDWDAAELTEWGLDIPEVNQSINFDKDYDFTDEKREKIILVIDPAEKVIIIEALERLKDKHPNMKIYES